MPYDDYDPDKPVWWDWLQDKKAAVKEALDEFPTDDKNLEEEEE